jgi:hypothetical protein
LQLTLDELAFLTPKDESQVASLVALFGIRDRLEDDLKDAGYT